MRLGDCDIVKPNLVVVVSGPSGAGKSTICQAFIERHEARLVVSCTTRPPRPGEEDGRDYLFVGRSDFEAGIEDGRFLEYAEVHGNLYGTPRDQVEAALAEGRDTILEIDVQGGLQVKAKIPEAVLIFVRTSTFAALQERLVGRGTDSADVIEVRMRNARRELEVMEQYDYFLLNDDLDEAVHDFLAIVDAEKCRIDRLARGMTRSNASVQAGNGACTAGIDGIRRA